MGDTHITGRHFGGDTHITSDMCAGIHISRGYTYHCDTGPTACHMVKFARRSRTVVWWPIEIWGLVRKGAIFLSDDVTVNR